VNRKEGFFEEYPSPMKIELVVVGNEILSGSIHDRHSAFVGQHLISAGHRLTKITAVGDDRGEISRAIQQALKVMDVVIVTGGLGPTHDDITREALADAIGMPLQLNRALLESIEEKFRRKNMEMPSVNEKQAFMPAGGRPLRNDAGIAPGIRMDIKGKFLFAIPGVPQEMKEMFTGEVLPAILTRHPVRRPRITVLRTTGIGESKLAGMLKSLAIKEDGFELASLPAATGVDLRFSFPPGFSKSREKTILNAVRTAFDEYIYASSSLSLEEVVGEILRSRKLTISIAESCTGGLISHRITSVPGSSAYFIEGLVTYSNRAKIDLLGVDPRDIETAGAVSREIATAMAKGVRHRANTDIGAAVTGIAGPEGGSDKKPVGTVFVGVAAEGHQEVRQYLFGGDRSTINLKSSQAVLDMIRKYILYRYDSKGEQYGVKC
jgi:nicotinamide-nucleotide amidase